MSKTRIWRIGTAALAASALLMATMGGATAQTPELGDVLDPGQLDQLTELLGDDNGEDNGGLTGTPLDDVLDQLGLDSLEDLLALLDGDNGDNGGDGEDGEPDPEIRDGEAGEGQVPEAGIGGFVGRANATGLEIAVGLPEPLRDGAGEVLDALGIGGPHGIHIKVADTEAELRRAAAGDEAEGLARALATNLLLDSGAADSPGACQPGEALGETEVELPPDQEVPLLRVALGNISCEESDERMFANAEVTGVRVSLAGLIEAGLPGDVADGVDQVLDPLNEQLLAEVNAACDDTLGALLGELLPGSDACEALELQIRNPFDVDVPLVDVSGLTSTSEVTADNSSVTADASATLASVNLAGLICVGTDGGDPLSHTAAVSTDGETGNANATAVDASRLCENDTSILRLIDGENVSDSLQLLGTDITNLLDGQLQQVFDGLDALADALGATVVTGGAPYETVEGSGAVAGVEPLTVVGLAPFGEIPGLDEFLGDLEVRVTAMEVEAAVNAAPDDGIITPAAPGEPEHPEEPPLPKTGAGAGLLGLAAMAGAVALRRRDEN